MYIIMLINTPSKIGDIVMFVSYKCTNINVFISTWAQWPGHGPQTVSLTLFESGNIFQIKAGEPKKQNIA